jgi:dTDP-4-amino-4,6-dideoxygalactose transaminase
MRDSSPIRLVDLNRQHEALREELISTFARVLSRGRFILGEEITKLEREFAKMHGCGHAVGVSSGTDALMLTLKALDIGPGDEVIVPAMTFFATAEAVCAVGATPVFADIEPLTLGLDPAQTEKAIRKQTKAIIPVHLHGRPVRLAPFLQMAEANGLAIIEDCAQGHGASDAGHAVGSRSVAGCFSFFPAKNLGALGDAGIVTTQSVEIAQRVRALANHGRREKHASEELGYNARLDELQAALLNVKLPYLAAWNESRRYFAQRYSDLLSASPLRLPAAANDDCVSSHHLYVVRCAGRAERDALAAHLKSRCIETGIHYPTPLHLQPALRHLAYAQGQFPVSERAGETMLSLPLFPEMRIDEQDRVVAAVLHFYQLAPSESAKAQLQYDGQIPAGISV